MLLDQIGKHGSDRKERDERKCFFLVFCVHFVIDCHDDDRKKHTDDQGEDAFARTEHKREGCGDFQICTSARSARSDDGESKLRNEYDHRSDQHGGQICCFKAYKRQNEDHNRYTVGYSSRFQIG